jgi:hypothetical protein
MTEGTKSSDCRNQKKTPGGNTGERNQNKKINRLWVTELVRRVTRKVVPDKEFFDE